MNRRVEISSRANPWVRRFREAIDLHEDEIVIEGPRHVRDAIERGLQPLAIAVSGDAAPPATSAPSLQLSGAVAKALTETVHAQGVLGLFARPEGNARDVLSSGRTVVVLDGVQDPGNVGTIIRLAAAFGAGGMLLTEGSADPFGSKAIRASAGAVLAVPIARLSRIETARMIAEANLPLFVASAEGATDVVRPERSAIAFGSEGSGVSAELRENAVAIGIPTSGAVESLNVASAAAILLAEGFRYRASLPYD